MASSIPAVKQYLLQLAGWSGHSPQGRWGSIAGTLGLFGSGGMEGEGRGRSRTVLLTGGLAGQGSWPKAQEDDLSEPGEVSRPSSHPFSLAHSEPSFRGVPLPLASLTATCTSWNNITTGGQGGCVYPLLGPHPRHQGF